MDELVYTDDAKKKASVTRLFNKIEYFYIPALKGSDVLSFILGEIGKRQLIDNKDIETLNSVIDKNIGDLRAILNSSAIRTETES